MKFVKAAVLLLSIVFIFHGCGGGGGGSNSDNDTSNPTDNTTDPTELQYISIDDTGTDVSGYSRDTDKTLVLNKGWNLVALPVDITIQSQDFLTYFEDYLDIYIFDSSGCNNFNPDINNWNSNPEKNINTIFSSSECWIKNPDEIKPGQGFWINMNSAKNVSFEGDLYGVDEITAPLDEGWHLLGSGFDTNTALFSDFTDEVWTFNTNDSTWASDSLSVSAGSGFWFYKGGSAATVVKMRTASDSVFTATGKSTSLNISNDQCTTLADGTIVCDTPVRQTISTAVGQPLFVDNEFKGIVAGIKDENGKTSYSLKSATYVTDVYDNFDIELSSEEVTEQITRSVKKFRGKYDSINKKGLTFEVRTVEVPAKPSETRRIGKRSADDKVKEYVLRVNFPKGYKIPIKPKSLDCDFLEASCDGMIQVNENKKIDLGESITKGNITISTEGSYVDFGLGAYMRAKYDANLIEDDVYVFEVSTSAYFESNVVFTVSGEYEFEWQAEVELLDMIDVEIAHPYSAVAAAIIGFQPTIEFGSKGSLELSLEAKAQSRREGEVGFRYSSTTQKLIKIGRVAFIQSPENGVNFEAKVEGEVYMIPRIAVRPKLEFLRISQPLSFGEIRGGVKVNSILNGEVQTGFVVGNDGFNVDIGKTELGIDVGVSALIDYILQIRLGDKEFWSMDDYAELYESDRLIVFDWKIGLLKAPTYDDAAVQSGSGRDIQFATPETEHPDKIKYYYQIVPVGTDPAMPNLFTFRNTATLLNGDTINIPQNSILLVQSVLLNSDISDSVWSSFGTSLSPVSMFAIEVEEEEPQDQCDANNLNLCNDVSACENAGGVWSNGQCQADSGSDPDEEVPAGAVKSPYTGRIWMDKNIGASRVCTSITDQQCLGDYLLYDEISCPDGFRIPKIGEVYKETIQAGNDDATKVYNSFLKMPTAGRIDTWSPDEVQWIGQRSYFWSSDFCMGEGSYTHCVNTDADILAEAERGVTMFSIDDFQHYVGGGAVEYWSFWLNNFRPLAVSRVKFPARCIKDEN